MKIYKVATLTRPFVAALSTYQDLTFVVGVLETPMAIDGTYNVLLDPDGETQWYVAPYGFFMKSRLLTEEVSAFPEWYSQSVMRNPVLRQMFWACLQEHLLNELPPQFHQQIQMQILFYRNTIR